MIVLNDLEHQLNRKLKVVGPGAGQPIEVPATFTIPNGSEAREIEISPEDPLNLNHPENIDWNKVKDPSPE